MMKPRSAEHLAWIKDVIAVLEPWEAEEFCALNYWDAVYEDAAEQAGTSVAWLIEREAEHADGLRAKRVVRERDRKLEIENGS